MIVPKTLVAAFLLCLVSECLSKPTAESDLNTGRGLGSTLWSWITYPLTWWSSEPEYPPIHNQLIGSTTTYGPRDTIEIGKHNVTVWCNDQTCTTMRCDQFGCTNLTCNIYDTDLMGECREYNIISTPEEHRPKPTEPMPKPIEEKVTESPNKVIDTTAAIPTTITQKYISPDMEHPLQLEAALSSTVNDKTSDEKTSGIVVLDSEQKV